MESKSRGGNRKRNGDVFLGTCKQRLAAFTVLLMLALGIVVERHDYDQPHSHVDTEFVWAGNVANSYSRRISVDSGATAVNVNTGALGLLAALCTNLNVTTIYDERAKV
jgi:hypothetical protein